MSPTPLATTSKATAHQALARRAGDWWNFTTTSIGNAGKTTAVAAELIGWGDDFPKDRYTLLTSGNNAGEWRRISDFTSSSGTITVVTAYTNQVASGVTGELHVFRPDLYTTAINHAIVDAYPAVYKPVTGFALTRSGGQAWYGTPRGMRDIVRVSYSTGSEKASDGFDRDDSTTTAGSDYTAAAGTWGISSNKLYAVTDANANLLTRDVGAPDGYLKARISGTLNSATDYRSPALVFRFDEDDSGNDTYLCVRLLNGSVDLRKNDNGTESSLDTGTLTTSDGVDYIVEVLFTGPWVRVFVDGVELINYELLGTDLKYLAYEAAGFRLDKGGSPATAARWDDWRVHKAGAWVEVHDFEQTPDRRAFQLGGAGHAPGFATDTLLIIEGRAPLTLLSENTTWGTLASYSTAVLEIATDDPAWDVLIQTALAYLYRLAAQPVAGYDEDDRATYARQAQAEQAQAERLKGKHAMPRPRKLLAFPH